MTFVCLVGCSDFADSGWCDISPGQWLTFLRGISIGSVGLGIGCGNGKYLAVNPDVFIVGSDRSVLAKNLASFRMLFYWDGVVRWLTAHDIGHLTLSE